MCAMTDNFKNQLAGRVYQRVLAGRYLWFWRRLRNILIKVWNDPACRLPIHGRMLYLPLSHELPQYLTALPLYDSLLVRLASFLREKDGQLFAIDVGANIGDTLAALYSDTASRDAYLAVEPNPHFRTYLTRNWIDRPNVTILPYLCVAGQSEGRTYKILEYNGTAEIIESETGQKFEERTLEHIVASYPDFQNCNLIKIDTDGHDFEVIRGAASLIRQKHPTIFFEAAPMSNVNFVEECVDTLKFFAEAGYQSFFAYDNFGHFVGQFSLTDLDVFIKIITFQLASRLFFIDILIMSEEDARLFGPVELKFHILSVSDAPTRVALDWVLRHSLS